MTQQENLVTIDTISGPSLRIVQAAMPEFHRQGLDGIERYKIVVLESQTSFMVLFDDPDAPITQRGSKPGFGLQVELSRSDLAIIGSNFSR